MSYPLTEQQELLRQTVRQIAREVVEPRAADIDERAEFPWDVKKVFAEHDLLGLCIPEEYGGVGADDLSLCLAIEEVAGVCASSSLIIILQALGALPMLIAADEDQRRRYYPRIASGEVLMAYALTEAGAGSDVASMATRAVRKGDRYVLNGVKQFISQGPVADVVTTFAVTEPGARHRGITAFVVEREFPGFRVGKIERKLGIRGSPTSEIVFEECEVPVANRLGEEGEGFKIAMQVFDRSRVGIAAQALGIAQGALDCARSYAKQRTQFGRPIADFQAIQFMLADMAMQTEAARQMVYRAAELAYAGAPEKTIFSSMAKCFASDVAMRVATDAVQIYGGYGYIKDFPVERMLRDAKITQIYEGTNQIQRLVIARRLLAEEP